MEFKLHQNQNRYTIFLMDGDNKAGRIEFELVDNIMNVDHTVVEETYAGQGLAKKLFNEVVLYARENNYKINAICSYVAKCFEKDPSLNDLKA